MPFFYHSVIFICVCSFVSYHFIKNFSKTKKISHQNLKDLEIKLQKEKVKYHNFKDIDANISNLQQKTNSKLKSIYLQIVNIHFTIEELITSIN